MTTISREALGLAPTQPPAGPAQQSVGVGTLANFGEVCLTDPSRLDLCVYRGDSGHFRVTVTTSTGAPVNVSGATWDCDIRKTVDTATTAGSMTVTPVVGITNAVDVTLTATVSASLNDPPYVWDLEMRIGTEVTTVLAGELTVTRDVFADAMSDLSVTVALSDAAVTVAIPAAPTVNLTATVGPSGPNEVWIGPDYPTDPTVEFWWRTDTAPASVWDLGVWDVDVWVP